METVALIVLNLALGYAVFCGVSIAVKVKKAGKCTFRPSRRKVLFKGIGATLWGMLFVHHLFDGNPGWMSSFGMALFLVTDLIEESIEIKE